MKGEKRPEPLKLKGNEDKRIESMNVAQAISRVVSSSEAFSLILEAVKTNNKDLFVAACKAAYVPLDMAVYLKDIVFNDSVVAQKAHHDAEFCW